MNEQQLAAVKQALEALEKSLPRLAPYGEQDWLDSCKAITALQSIIAQHALDKKADNARELGLSYDDEPKIGCVNHDCDQCKAVQEPAPQTWELTTPATALSGGGGSGSAPVQEPVAIVDEDGVIVVCNYKYKPGDKLYTTPPAPQPVPVKTYHDGKPWPVAPKPWVGLTDAEVMQTMSGDWTSQFYFARAIEAKLKELNA
jgi:hypothetical protein